MPRTERLCDVTTPQGRACSGSSPRRDPLSAQRPRAPSRFAPQGQLCWVTALGLCHRPPADTKAPFGKEGPPVLPRSLQTSFWPCTVPATRRRECKPRTARGTRRGRLWSPNPGFLGHRPPASLPGATLRPALPCLPPTPGIPHSLSLSRAGASTLQDPGGSLSSRPKPAARHCWL